MTKNMIVKQRHNSTFSGGPNMVLHVALVGVFIGYVIALGLLKFAK